MPNAVRLPYTLGITAVVVVFAGMAAGLLAEADVKPVNDLPNPYQDIERWGQLPEGRSWGSTAGVDIAPNGNVWAYDRCGANSCAASTLPPILEFDPSGKLLRSWGAGMFVFPHGFYVDKDGNVWVTDGQGNKEGTKGHQVFKFSPDGKILLTLGKPGVAGNGPDTFNEPNDVVTAPNGDIFVADGHSGQSANPPPNANARIVKFTKDGKFIKSWGKLGSAPGEFRTPHTLAIDSAGRLFVGDRGNVRIQIFDQDGKLLEEWKQFGRPSGIFIAKDDTIYVADSESNKENHPGWRRGIRIGNAKTGTVTAFIPDPKTDLATATGTSAAEGVAVDAHGSVFGAEVGPKQLVKHVKK